MRIFFTLIIVILFSWVGYAQTREISGLVSDSKDNSPLPGVTVVVKGSTTGTITDGDGNYRIRVPEGFSTLIFSFIGMENQEITLTDQTTYNVALKTSQYNVEEVVVTSLGITKKKKALGYSVANIKGEAINLVKDANIMNSLAGKVSGVQVSKSAGEPDASTRVIIRGNNSLQGNNQPLYVVDGIPINSNNFGQTTASADGIGVGQGFERGSGISDINPEDVESISVLKGPNAAALYGSRAANGVVLITTKKGSKRKGIGVSFSSNTSLDVPKFVRKYQNTYGFGNNGVSGTNADGIMEFPSQIEGSWGSRMEGQTFIDWDGVERTYDPQPNNYRDFFQTGYTFTNSVALSGGNDKVVYRLSYTDLSNKGITPNNTFGRNAFSIRTGVKLTEKLSVDAKVSYVNHKAENRNFQADGHSVSRNYIHMPRSVSDASLRDYEDGDGREKVWRDNDRQSNPYWVAYKNLNSDKRDRFIGNISLTYDITAWLKLMLRTGADMLYNSHKSIVATGAKTRLGTDGQLYEGNQFTKELNSDFLFMAEKKLNEKFSISATMGGSDYYYKSEAFSDRVTRSSTPNFYNIQYSKDEIIAWTNFAEKRTQSLYGTAQLAYNKFLYLDLTARNDWSSTLPQKNNSYFYPSVTGSFLFSEFFKNDHYFISFGKVRASWAKVGSDTGPYRLTSVYYSAGDYNGNPRVNISPVLPAINLNPETTYSTEFGTDIRFFNNRMGIDLTVYKSATRNQILGADIARSSGFNAAMINAGEIENKGVEVQLNAQPFKRQNGLVWDISLNYSKNQSKVISLTDGLDNLILANHWNLTVEASPNQPYGDLVGVEIARDENGNKLIGADGRYIRGERVVLGNYNPDWLGSVINNVTYKNFALNFLIDMRMGGEIYSATNHYGQEKGTFTETLEGREGWYASEEQRLEAGISTKDWEPTGGYLAEGVLEDGTVNTTFMNPELYFNQFAKWTKEIHEPYVYDATQVKLRELSLAYTLPQKITDKLNIQSTEIAVTGRNMWTIYKNAPNIDPESVYNSTNAQGIEYAALPPVRSFSFSLKIQF